MKILINPTDNKVGITYKGTQYEIEPQDRSIPLQDEVVDFWLRTHSFLTLAAEVAPEITAEPVAEAKGETEAGTETLSAEVTATPKKRGRKPKVVLEN